jgi:diphthamide biosynthesis protein 2
LTIASQNFRNEALGMTIPTPVALSSATDLSQDAHVEELPAQAPFDELYEILETCMKIEAGDFRCVALQFPDELLKDSVRVYQSLRQKLSSDREIYVLADTTYGR